MTYINPILQHPLILVFVFMNLAIGWWAHRKAKVGSFEDYAMASRSLPTGVLVMTLLGTFVTSAHFGGAGGVARQGMLSFIPVFVVAFVFFLMGTLIAPNLVYFQNVKTSGDLMGLFYGQFAKFITSIIGSIISIAILSGQLKAIGQISNDIWGINASKAIILFGLFITIYSVVGGIRVVSYMDVLQMIFIITILVCTLNTSIKKSGSLENIFQKLPEDHTLFFNHPNFFSYLRLMCLAWVVPTTVFSPPIVQRMLITNDKRQVKHMWYITAFLLVFVLTAIKFIALSGLALGIKVDLKDKKSVAGLFLTTVRLIFQSKSMLSLVAIGMLSVSISTIDSFLHAIGISLVQDLFLPLIKHLKLPLLREKRKIFFARFFMVLIAILSISVAYFSGASLKFMKIGRIAKLFSPIIVIPLIIGILGVKTYFFSWLSFCVGYIMSGFILYLKYGSWYTTRSFGYYLGFMSLLATLAYFATHIYLNKGIAILSRSKLTVSERLWLPSWNGTVKKLHSWVTAPLRIPLIADRKVITTPPQSLAFSLVMIFLYMLSSVVNVDGTNDVLYMMTVIRGIGITLCVGLMLEGIWSKSIKPYFPMYWFFTLWYCLPFSGTLALLQSPSVIGLALWGSSFLVLAILVDSSTFFTLSTLGSTLVFGGWKVVFLSFPADLWKERNIIALIIIFVSTISMLLFARQREDYTAKRLEWNRIAGGILAHDLRDTVQVLNASGIVLGNAFEEGQAMKNSQGEEGYHLLKGRASFFKNFSKEMIKKANFSTRDIARFMDFMEGQILGQFDQKKISMKEAALEAIQKLSSQISEKTQIICPKDFSAQTLSGVFPNVIINLLKNASSHGKAQNIKITIDAQKRTVTVRDDGKGVPPEVLPKIFELNYSTLESKNNTGTGLSFVRMVMEASGGKVFCYSKHGSEESYTEFILDFSKR